MILNDHFPCYFIRYAFREDVDSMCGEILCHLFPKRKQLSKQGWVWDNKKWRIEKSVKNMTLMARITTVVVGFCVKIHIRPRAVNGVRSYQCEVCVERPYTDQVQSRFTVWPSQTNHFFDFFSGSPNLSIRVTEKYTVMPRRLAWYLRGWQTTSAKSFAEIPAMMPLKTGKDEVALQNMDSFYSTAVLHPSDRQFKTALDLFAETCQKFNIPYMVTEEGVEIF